MPVTLPCERMPEPLFILRVPRPSRGFLAVLSSVASLVFVRVGVLLDPHAAGRTAIGIDAAYEPRAGLAAICWAGAGALVTLAGCLLFCRRSGGASGKGRPGLRVIDGGGGDGGAA